ncbi:MAG TPA: type II secretion system protein [Candidatus Gastranaerophilales bacterium]|nr:type II secretion system protein [Candidatus Gastranaerophilales bacterium]
MSFKKGYSLTEVIIATVIIGVIAAFVAGSMPISLAAGNEAQEVSKATELAQRYMETIKSELSYQSSYDLLSAGTTPPVPITTDFTDNGAFTVNTVVTDLETAVIGSNTLTVLKEIDVEYLRTDDSISIINISILISRPE